MLLRFSVSNWKSFKESVSLSMVASKEKQHDNHIQYLPEYKLNVLPIAVVFGANAAGKSNLIKAMDFARSQIISTNFDAEYTKQVDVFRLDSEYLKKESSFEFAFTINDVLYKYVFSLSREGNVYYEKLERAKGKKLTVVYERNADGNFVFEKGIKKDVKDSIKRVGKNILVLPFVRIQNLDGVDELKRIYSWFRFKFVVITPATRLIHFTDESMPTDKLSAVLHKLDTSVVKIDFISVSDYQLLFSKTDIEKIEKALRSGSVNVMATGRKDDYYKFELNENGELKCSKLISYHTGESGLVPFEIAENSDGTRRCLNLFPAFNDLVKPDSDCCYIIDELDRSLHTNLVKQLLASFLETRNLDTRSQLILTNHDIEQMDQDVLRRDEIWITERNAQSGATELSSLDEFVIKDAKIRKDRNLPKLYLDGCLGGVPNIESYANLFDYADGGTDDQ